MQKIKGEESISMWGLIAAGSGVLEQGERIKLLNRYQALCGIKKQAPSPEQRKIMLAGVGIKVVECQND
jgi:hypothetical protein